jgi:uncharacterized protein (TIGR00251 family)
MEWIRDIDNGVSLRVRATPRASKNEIQGIYADALKIRLTSPPVEGKANAALIRFLSKTLAIPRSSISLSSGETGRQKVFTLYGVTQSHVRERLSL